MKNIYFVGYSDYIAADSQKQALKTWSKLNGESLDDYPDLEIELIKRDEIIKVWADTSEQDEIIAKPAEEWAAEANHPEMICSLNW